MDLMGGIDGRVLQYAGTVHDRIDAREMPAPCFGLAGAREVDLDPVHVGAALTRRLDVASRAHDLMAVGNKPCDHGRTDEAIGADDENPHDGRDLSARRGFARTEIASSGDRPGLSCDNAKSERNLVVHIAALAAGADSGRTTLAHRAGGAKLAALLFEPT